MNTTQLIVAYLAIGIVVACVLLNSAGKQGYKFTLDPLLTACVIAVTWPVFLVAFIHFFVRFMRK